MVDSPPTPRLPAARKQVFVAYSYRLYPKDDYRKLYKELEKAYDVTFIFADEKITNMHIMKKIESFIRGSDFSLFDISGWNPNVTLELGFAMALPDYSWYIALDPSKTEIKEVPSDLRGLDRIEYGSYSELENRLRVLLEQRYPRRTQDSIETYLEQRRTEILQLLKEKPGLTMTALHQLMRVEVGVAQLAIKPLVEKKKLETRGDRKGTKYYLLGDAPPQSGKGAGSKGKAATG